jgi:hypothetical protein
MDPAPSFPLGGEEPSWGRPWSTARRRHEAGALRAEPIRHFGVGSILLASSMYVPFGGPHRRGTGRMKQIVRVPSGARTPTLSSSYSSGSAAAAGHGTSNASSSDGTWRGCELALQDKEAQESIGRLGIGNDCRTQRTARRMKASKSSHPTRVGKRQGGTATRRRVGSCRAGEGSGGCGTGGNALEKLREQRQGAETR